MSSAALTFLSDYGLQDDFVGLCHAVIATIAPQVRVIDLVHGIPRHDVRAGALALQGALQYLPAGVHLAIVDPDVGAQRRAVAVRAADERLLVGPDNGLLSLAAESAGGAVQAVDIARSRFRLEPVSATFHGRDIFSPVAARLASGVALEEVGDPCDPQSLVTLELPHPRVVDGALIAHALYIDRFGNVQLDIAHEDLADTGLRLGHRVEVVVNSRGSHEAQYARTFADVEPDQLLIYEDAYRRLAIAVSHGDAARLLGVVVDDELQLRPV